MTKEQEEALYRLKLHSEYAVLSNDKLAVVNKADIETVLNMLKEKDKIIDLMAKFIYAMWCDYPGSITKKLKDNGFVDKECGTCENKEKNCLDCIKQFFEQKNDK